MSWLTRLFARQRLERELDRELSFHVSTRAEELMAEGVPAAEARRRALAEFGGIEPIKEQARDARGTRWAGDFVQDVRYAVRMLASNKAFAAAAVLSLGVGIGANASVFRVLNSVVLRPLDVPRPSELFLVISATFKESRFSGPALLAMRKAAPDVQLAAMTPSTTTQTSTTGATQFTQTQLVTGNWFGLLGLTTSNGRLLTPADDVADARTAVISDRYWARAFDRSPSALGSTIRVNGSACTIVGVAPPGFNGVNVGQFVDIWLPVQAQPAVNYRGNASTDDADDEAPWWPQEGVQWLTVFGRRPAGVSEARTNAALSGAYHNLIAARAARFEDEGRRRRALAEHLEFDSMARGKSNVRDRISPILTLLMGMVGLVLLAACANLANLLLARGAARTREFSLRLAIGARRGRLVRQLMTESLTLAAIGGVAGFLFAWWGGVALLRLLQNSSTAPVMPMPFDWRVIGFGAALTLVTGAAFGILPALRLSRPALVDAMKSGGRVIDAGRRGRLPLVKGLVIVQVGLSLLLLVGAMLFFQTFQNLIRVDAGYDRESVINARFDTRLAGYAADQLPAVFARILERARQVPGVTAVALGRVGPATGSSSISNISIDGYRPAPDEEVVVHEDFVGPHFMSTLGMRLIAGRDFDERDTRNARKVAIINDVMARKYFGDSNPIGRTFGYDTDPAKQNVIIGVVRGVRSQGLREDVPTFAYYALDQNEGVFVRNLYVRTSAAPAVVAPLVKKAIEEAAPEMAVREVVSLGELTERTVASERMVSNITAAFGLLGVAVAILGLYGTIAYSVARRTNEIGVRLALGAEPGAVRWMVLRETLMLSVSGAVFGILLIVPLANLAASLVFGLSPRDPVTLAAGAAIVVALGGVAGAIPAWRASRVNPTKALRAD